MTMMMAWVKTGDVAMVTFEKYLLSEQMYILIMSQVKGNMQSMLMPSFWSKPPSKLWFHLLIGMAKP